MTRPGVPLLAFLLLGLASAPAYAQPGSALEAPAYTEGDFWEYRVEARLAELAGAENLTGSIQTEGLMKARVSSTGESNATLTWSGELSLQGHLALEGIDSPGEAALSGAVHTTYVEHREAPYLLATAVRQTVEFDLTVTLVISVPYAATLEMEATIPPGPGAPTYPVEAGTQEFTTVATVESNLTVSFLGAEVRNSSREEVTSTLRMEALPAGPMDFPVGNYSTVRVVTEGVTGVAPGPFLLLLPGAKQVAYHADAVGNAVVFQFEQNDVEVGNATLRAFSYSSAVAPPFWQQPAFLLGLLAVPIVVLVLLYWRERRKGL